MKCHNCGNDVPEESVFCGMCGARLESESVEHIEPVTVPITEPEPNPTEPIIDPITEPVEPTIEPVEPGIEPITEPVVEEVEAEYADSAQTDEFIINHCPHCGAVLISGAKFCSNCGGSVVIYEGNTSVKKARIKMIIAAVLAVIVIVSGVSILMNNRSIEGEWAVENSGVGFFDIFGESYLDFDDDGTAVYYNGLFSTKKYSYTYNRFTKVLTLQAAVLSGAEPERARLHVEWIDPYTITIRELNMTLYRIDDIPYAYDDDEFDDDDVVQF